uniref:Tudor domain-containing protein n=1 Tax=Bracon brevicornis TaxID=1563983 RepID=A0A6V7KGM2_9HYME
MCAVFLTGVGGRRGYIESNEADILKIHLIDFCDIIYTPKAAVYKLEDKKFQDLPPLLYKCSLGGCLQMPWSDDEKFFLNETLRGRIRSIDIIETEGETGGLVTMTFDDTDECVAEYLIATGLAHPITPNILKIQRKRGS